MGRYTDNWQRNIDSDDKIGCCGNLVRFMLFIVNALFLILGLTVFITAAILKWGDKSTFSKFTDIKGIDSIVSVGSIGTIAVIFLIISAFIILLSIVGIIGVKFLSKFFLIIYEIIVGIMFLAHLIAFLVLIFGSKSIEQKYKEGLVNTMKQINTGNNTKDPIACDLMKGLSGLFDCCGNEGPGDFNSTMLADKCCQLNAKNMTSQSGCGNASISEVKDNAINLVIIPSAIILLVELFALIMVPCLVGKSRH